MKFEDLRDWFKGEHCLVVAPGPSSKEPYFRAAYRDCWVIGCNRAVTYCHPDLAVCVEPFVDPIWPIMRKSSAAVVFSHLSQDRRGKKPHRRIVEFESKNVNPWFEPDAVDKDLWCAMSPFWGVAVAAWIGFEKVGLIGVDLTIDRYNEVWRENEKWKRLIDLIAPETEVINLSDKSRLTTVLPGVKCQIKPKVEYGPSSH